MAGASPRAEFDRLIYDQAIEYLERGWSIIPINPTTKVPLVEWRDYQTRQPTLDEVDTWFDTWAGFNIGLVTGSLSGIIVVDADTPEAVTWCEANGLTSPFSVSTRRGRHYYFAHPRNGERFRNVGHNPIKGGGLYGVANLDLRADGGFVVLPPSVSRSEEKGDYQYRWDPCYLDWDDLPVWSGKPHLKDVTGVEPGEFSFASLDLSGVRVSNPDDFLPVWQQAEKWVEHHGRKLADGDGRNNLLTKYVGEQVRAGVLGKALEEAVERFQQAFFAEHLEINEVAAMRRSVEEADRRNHPADYTPAGDRVVPQPAPTGRLRPVYPGDARAILSALGGITYQIDPWMQRPSITMVYGWTGSGKSWLLQLIMYHAALGRSFGPYDIERPWKVAYFDWELSATNAVHRMIRLQDAFGDAGRNFAYWSPGLVEAGADINMISEGGRALFQAWLEEMKPEIVVLDTIRSAWPGMEENKAEAWAPFNQLVLALRNAGISVVAVHHANKSTADGLGREAGSSNQLSNIETQLRVTQLFMDEAVAKDKNGRHEPEIVSRLIDMAERRYPGCRPYMFLDVSYGKVRSVTDNHAPARIAILEKADGTIGVVAALSPRQSAIELRKQGRTLGDIASLLGVPSWTVKDWLGIEE